MDPLNPLHLFIMVPIVAGSCLFWWMVGKAVFKHGPGALARSREHADRVRRVARVVAGAKSEAAAAWKGTGREAKP
ncbi:MAG: hypothetical protein U0835_00620 [Isosphaeraceae bacterium]